MKLDKTLADLNRLIAFKILEMQNSTKERQALYDAFMKKYAKRHATKYS